MYNAVFVLLLLSYKSFRPCNVMSGRQAMHLPPPETVGRQKYGIQNSRHPPASTRFGHQGHHRTGVPDGKCNR